MGEERDYQIGDTVHIRHAPDIDATITGKLTRGAFDVEYELTWMANGEIKVAWLRPLMIEAAKKNDTVGFKEQKK